MTTAGTVRIRHKVRQVLCSRVSVVLGPCESLEPLGLWISSRLVTGSIGAHVTPNRKPQQPRMILPA